MGRPGMSSGGGGSSGGHSSGRSSGGHYVGSSGRNSRPMGGSSTFRPGHSSGNGWGSPPPPPGGGIYHHHYYGDYGGYYPPRRSSSIGGILTAIFFLFVFLFVFVSSFSNDKQVSTRNREKIENPVAYTNDCVKDEIGYVEDVSALSRNLQNFYNKTGIQPYIYLKAYDASLSTDAEKEDYAKDWYDKNIDNEDTFLYVYFEDADPDEVGYMAYVNGKEVTSVMDAEAVSIFWNYIDRYWTDGSLTMVQVFTKTFDSTAKTIMTKSTTGKDLAKKGILFGTVLVGVVAVIVILRMHYKRQKEKAQETIEILNTPLNHQDNIRDKYL